MQKKLNLQVIFVHGGEVKMQNGQIKGAGSLEEGPRVNRDSRSLPRQISSTNTIEQQCVKYWH